VKTWDVVVIGGGIIGLSLALELSRGGAGVAVIERGEPGREASHAAGGMIADLDPVLPPELKPLATLSAQLYPEFVRLLQDESGHKIDFRHDGTIDLLEHPITPEPGTGVRALSTEEVHALEPKLTVQGFPYFMPENAVDPRDLVAALVPALRRRNVEIINGSPVQSVLTENGRATGVQTVRARYIAKSVVNCAGAWAPQVAPLQLPTRPVKGHMVALAFPSGTPGADQPPVLRHVIRSRWCYILPRSTGRFVVGSTVEPAGYDKTVNTYRIQRLHHAATNVIAEFKEARILEAWTGLRPGTPDSLPILGPTSIDGYFACTGHYRDGILLAPASARILTQIMQSGRPEIDISPFSPSRFNL